MTLSQIVVWFAERKRGRCDLRRIRANLGNVKPLLDHLVQLGILESFVNHYQGALYYYLTDHAVYHKAKPRNRGKLTKHRYKFSRTMKRARAAVYADNLSHNRRPHDQRAA